MVVAVVPHWLLFAFTTVDSRWTVVSSIVWLPRTLGGLLFSSGLVLFAWCVKLFAFVGKGTLAPWDPTRRLIAGGPYRYVRNPMISGVASMLTGEALICGSWVLAGWVFIFLCINHVYFLLSEEPALERRFGDDYRLYKMNVPRWIPGRRPWRGNQPKDEL